jgi:hypothetical protein
MIAMQSTDNQSILRLLIGLVVVTTGLTIYAGLRLEHTLPAPLYAFVHSQDNGAGLSPSQTIAGLVILVLYVLVVAGIIGLWWCRRWARWTFTIAALAMPVLSVYLGIVDPTTLIANAVESGANTASNMAIGATLAMIWLGMGPEFDQQAAHGSRGTA